MLLNCGVVKPLESPFYHKEIQPVHPKGNQSCIFIGRADAETETPILWPSNVKKTHWKRPWCWARLKAAEGDDRGWDVWMASLTRWTWVWVSSGSWRWTGKPGMLPYEAIGSQSQTGLSNWTELKFTVCLFLFSSLSLIFGLTINQVFQPHPVFSLTW